MENNNVQELLEKIKKVAIIEGGKTKVACKELFKLAEENNVPYTIVGKICNQNNIKIFQCQLGCF